MEECFDWFIFGREKDSVKLTNTECSELSRYQTQKLTINILSKTVVLNVLFQDSYF